MRRRLVLAVALTVSFGAAAAEPQDAPFTLLQLANDELLVSALYPQVMDQVTDDAPSGAVGVNAEWEAKKREKFFIESQRWGGDYIQAGTCLKDDKLLEKGWRFLDWGFARQGEDGGFPGTSDSFHSTSYFIEAAARAVLLYRQSGRPDAEAVVAKYRPKLQAAGEWLVRPTVASEGRRKNLPYTHRRWALAAALGQVGAVTGDSGFLAIANEYARDGLAMQQEDGVNPEKGGFDVNYQASGIVFACRFWTVCDDAELRDRVAAMIVKGMHWEAAKIDEEGTLAIDGSSRVGKEDSRDGKQKKVNYRNLIQALRGADRIHPEPVFSVASRRVAVGRGWIVR